METRCRTRCCCWDKKCVRMHLGASATAGLKARGNFRHDCNRPRGPVSRWTRSRTFNSEGSHARLSFQPPLPVSSRAHRTCARTSLQSLKPLPSLHYTGSDTWNAVMAPRFQVKVRMRCPFLRADRAGLSSSRSAHCSSEMDAGSHSLQLCAQAAETRGAWECDRLSCWRMRKRRAGVDIGEMKKLRWTAG